MKKLITFITGLILASSVMAGCQNGWRHNDEASGQAAQTEQYQNAHNNNGDSQNTAYDQEESYS